MSTRTIIIRTDLRNEFIKMLFSKFLNFIKLIRITINIVIVQSK